MAYSKALAVRIRNVLICTPRIVEKQMFGGRGFLLHGNMCVGVWEDSLIARVGPDAYQAALDQPHAREFDFSGRAMKGWVLVEPTAWKQIANWTTRSVAFVITLPQK